MSRRPVATLAVRRYLVSIYVTKGYEAAKPLALKHGYNPRYLCQMAKEVLGHYRTIFYSRNPLTVDQSYRFDPRFDVVRADPLQEAA